MPTNAESRVWFSVEPDDPVCKKRKNTKEAVWALVLRGNCLWAASSVTGWRTSPLRGKGSMTYLQGAPWPDTPKPKKLYEPLSQQTSCSFWKRAKDCSGKGFMICFQEMASRPSTPKPTACLCYWRIRKSNRLRRTEGLRDHQGYTAKWSSELMSYVPWAMFSRIGWSCWYALQRRSSISNETNGTLREAEMCCGLRFRHHIAASTLLLSYKWMPQHKGFY